MINQQALNDEQHRNPSTDLALFFVLEPGHINVMPDDREHDVIKTKIYFSPPTKPPSLPKDDLKSKSCT